MLLDGGAGALDQFLGFDGALGEVEDAADVLLHGAADLLVLVGVDQGADAFVGEHLGEQALVDARR